MSLGEHLQELRYRLVVSIAVIATIAIVCGFFYQQLLALMSYPWHEAVSELKSRRPEIDTSLVYSGITSPFTLAVKVALVGAVVVAAPVWLYQLWAFIAPALLPKEKKWALTFVGAATPLFLMGVAMGYWVTPKGIAFMLDFTPDRLDVTNLVDMSYFIGLLIRFMLMAGVSFLIPVVTVVLNFAGIVKARAMATARVYVIFGCFVFAAVATPSGDPLSMMAIGVPMALLFIIAELVAHVHDRRAEREVAADA